VETEICVPMLRRWMAECPKGTSVPRRVKAGRLDG
jgi:hypothetical protein